MRTILALAASLVPALALAGSDGERGCSVRVDTRDGLVRSGDVEVRRDDPVRDVVALHGRVVVRAGATVDDATAIGGDVVLEEGAVVRGDATSIGGHVKLAERARVRGDATALGGAIELAEGARILGGRSALTAQWNGEPLASRLLEQLDGALDGDCRIEIRGDDDE
jgi:hypothetical protein